MTCECDNLAWVPGWPDAFRGAHHPDCPIAREIAGAAMRAVAEVMGVNYELGISDTVLETRAAAMIEQQANIAHLSSYRVGTGTVVGLLSRR